MEIIHRDTDYAIRAMVLLASCQGKMSVAELARSEQVPVEFLKKIMQKLKNCRLVESAQGPFGGYKLAKRPDDITLYEIIAAVQGPVYMNVCFADPSACDGSNACILRNMLGEIGRNLRDSLDGVTLEDILFRMESKNG